MADSLSLKQEELNKASVLDSILETPTDRLFSIKKKEEKEILIEFNNMVNEISRIEEINPTLFFSKQSQKILMHNTLSLGLDEALKGITKWRTGLIKEPFSVLMNSFGVS